MNFSDVQEALNRLDSLRDFIIDLSEKRKLEGPVSLENFGDVVRDRRKEQGMTQVDFAALVGVSKNLLVSVEKGTLTASMGNYKKIADALGIKIVFQ